MTLAGVPYAFAQPGGVIGGPGPDVIIGELPDTFSYGTQGATGIFAYDIGTESCNAGSANLDWFASTNRHPVIAQNVYRIKNGRFEQIGMSWVKHGFAALTGNACQIGCNGQGGSVLGVGCSDPYTFGINGLQGGLGPRSLINPATGAFPFPYSAPGFSGAIARRIQIAATDIDAALNPGAIYIGEGIYVTPDDALAGNAWNNASYRQIMFAGDAMRTSSYVSGSPTRRGKPAIYAWQEFDPSVVITPLDIPGDGQVIIAQRVTEVGTDLWHYEFAIENLSSDRSIRAVEVGAIAAAMVSNVGFHAPTYHSGEPFESTPWTGGRTLSGVRWETSTFAANPNASALRWGTAYSFRFDSTQRPAAGSVQIDLFKPAVGGSPSSVQFRALTPGGGSMAPSVPAGDQCAFALVAHPGVNGASTLNATGAGPGACDASGSTAIDADIWFRYTFNDTCAGTLSASTCGSTFDSKLAVYLASCPISAGLEIACNDDASPANCTPPAGASGASSGVSFTAAPGATYFFRVGSRDGSTGNVVLTITPPRCAPPAGACCFLLGACQIIGGSDACTASGGLWQGDLSVCTPINPCPQPPSPANDLCANAILVGDVLLGAPLAQGTNVNALTDGTIACEGGARDVWYRYTPVVAEAVSVSLCDTSAPMFSDTVLQVLSGSCTSPVQVACNDDFCGSRSAVNFSGAAGTPYLIRVMGFGGISGSFVLRVTGGGGVVTGACCRGSICQNTTQAACNGSNSRFAGVGSTCNPAGNTSTPCCKADFNQNGALSVQDVFDFLDAWFAGQPEANFAGGSGTPTVQSVFDFLTAWFAGGC